MNKIYKLVWSKVRSAWVVTSEIAKGHGKDSSSGRNRKLLKAGVVMTLLGGFMTAGMINAGAALTPDQKAVYDAVMEELNAERGVVHYFSVNDVDSEIDNYNNDGATGTGSIAIGKKTKSSGKYSVAIGNEAAASGYSTVALGWGAQTNGNYGVAIGQSTKVSAPEGVAIGSYADVVAYKGVAIGTRSYADREGGMLGYASGAKSNDLDAVLEAAGQKEELQRLRAIANPFMPKYLEIGEKFNEASRNGDTAKQEAAMQEMKQYMADNPEFANALRTLNYMSNTWQASESAVSIGDSRYLNTRQIIGVAAGTKDTDAVNVAQLKALNTKVDNGAIHYYSVTSDKKAAGSNFDNDGAKAADSMVIGIGSTSEAPNSTVVGNNNTLKRYNADKNGLSSLNNIVVGQNMEVEGAHNAVFGTDYQNNRENRKTMVAGKYNTVIGVGNLAGYTAEKDPQDRSKWIYSKVENGSDSGNVVVGMNNTATRSSIVIGAESEASSHGTSVGSNNKVIGDGDYGLALGNDLTVNGEQAVAIGSGSKATVDYTMAIGQEAIAEKESSIALGNTAKAENKYSVAVGSFATATARSGVAIGSSSLADREKGAIGYLAEANTTSEAWKATRGAISIGNSDKKYTRQLTGLAAGTEDTDAVNVAQLKALNTKVDNGAIHYFSVKSDDSANPAGTNWNNDGATGDKAIAIGQKAGATGTSDIAIGTEAQATGGWGVAIGQAAKAKASTAVAMAYGAEAKGANSLAIGILSEAKTNDSTAYGREAKALGEVALAVGMQAKAEGDHSAVFGAEAVADSTAWNGTAIGRGAYIGKQAADGTTPDTGVSNNYYTPVDDDTVVEAGKETENSTAVGFGAKSFGYQNTALGAGAEAFDTNTVAVGVMSKAIGHYANAFGKQARAEGENSTAIGHFARALGASSMALGDYAITSTMDGTGKVNQSVALGSHARVAADNSLALGYNSLASIADDVDTEAYLSKEAFKKENGVVSVGNKAYTIGDETIAQNYRRITNVAGGADANDAVNVAQLKVVNAKADKNAEAITNLTNTVNANGKATIVKVDGEENKADGNLTIKKTEKDGQTTYDLSLSDNITIGKDGKDGKIGINGKDGKSADITVGKGEAGVDGKDGITRIIYTDKDKKIHEVATLDDGLKFKGDNDDVVIRKLNTQLNITGGADAADLSDDNIGVVGTAGDNGGMKVKLSKKLKGLTSAEFKDGDNVTNITAGDISITKKDGDTTKTVNLWDLSKTVETNAKATKVTVDGEENSQNGNLTIKKTEKDGQLTYDLSLNDNITIGKDGKDGKIGINGKDGKSADITVGKGEAGVDGKDGETITRIIYKDEKGETRQVATLDDGLKFKGDNDTVVTRKLNQQLNITGGADAADLSDNNIGVVGAAGDNGGMKVKLSKKLKGLTSAEFKDGDNVTNIKAGDISITKNEGGKTTTRTFWEISNKVDENTTKINNIETNIDTKIDQKIEDAKITVEGDTDTGVKATAVTDNADKVTGYKVSLDKKVTVGNVTIDGTGEGADKKGEITGLTNKNWDGENIVSGRAATEDQLKAAMGKVQAQSRTTVKGSKNITVTPNTASAAEYTVGLANDISVNSVTANEYKVGDKTYINQDGINANGKKITNVADGTVSADSTDAVNGKQLYEVSQQIEKSTMGNVQKELSAMGDRVDKVGAGAAALAGLHPLDFDPENKWDFAASYGNYNGANAVAIGAFYRPNESKMFSVGGSFGGGENMLNVGFSMKVGKGNEYMKLSRPEMAQKLEEQSKEIQEMKAKDQERDAQMQEIMRQLQLLQAQAAK